jgi:hypothetical protein
LCGSVSLVHSTFSGSTGNTARVRADNVADLAVFGCDLLGVLANNVAVWIDSACGTVRLDNNRSTLLSGSGHGVRFGAASTTKLVYGINEFALGVTGQAIYQDTNTPITIRTSTNFGINVRDYGAKGDGTTDDSAAFQTAINALSTVTDGGTIFVPDGHYKVANVQLKEGINLIGSGSGQYGFSGQGYGAIMSIPTTATSPLIMGVNVTAGGTGYSSAPTVGFTGGGGTGAKGTAYVSGGALTRIEVTDPGIGYTSDPTVTLTGGAGSGATTAVVRGDAVLFTSGTKLLAGNIRGITFRGAKWAGHSWAGVIIHDSFGFRILDCDFYDFDLQAIWMMAGQSMEVSHGKIFGATRTGVGVNFGYHIGSLQLDGTDTYVSNCEIGGYKSEDQVNLWNAAVQLGPRGGACDMSNIVAEGADVGVRIGSPNDALVNVRADINYGHGIYIDRWFTGVSPPSNTKLTACWGHRNSKYVTNTFDNFRIEDAKSIAGISLIGCKSTYAAADGYAHRYGYFLGNATGLIMNSCTDNGALTRWIERNSGTAVGIGELPGDLVLPATGSTTFSVAQRRFVRVNNSTPTLIASMTGGIHGQVVYIQVLDSGNTTIGGASNSADQIHTRSGTALTTIAYGVYPFVCIYGTWYQCG